MSKELTRRQNDDDAPLGRPAAPEGQDAMMIATTRAAQEVQAAMVVAKRFPRDVFAAEKRILDACKRPGFAARTEIAHEAPVPRLPQTAARGVPAVPGSNLGREGWGMGRYLGPRSSLGRGGRHRRRHHGIRRNDRADQFENAGEVLPEAPNY